MAFNHPVVPFCGKKHTILFAGLTRASMIYGRCRFAGNRVPDNTAELHQFWPRIPCRFESVTQQSTRRANANSFQRVNPGI